MPFDDLLLVVLLAAGLFMLTNWLGGHSVGFGYASVTLFDHADDSLAFNVTFRVLTPQVFLLAIATTFYFVGIPLQAANLWFVTLVSFLLRWGFILMMGRGGLVDWPRHLKIGLLAIAVSWWLSSQVLIDPARFIPDATDLTTELWVVVILFLYSIAKQRSSPDGQAAQRRSDYLRWRFSELRRDYGAAVDSVSTTALTAPLSYAIMVLETFNRPRAYQLIERHLLFPLCQANSIGPMQVKTTTMLSDDESVKKGVRTIDGLVADKLRELAEQAHSSGVDDNSTGMFSYDTLFELSYEVAKRYNPSRDYAFEVREIFFSLVWAHFPELLSTERESDLREVG